jgi:hypothetical protein
VKCIRNVLAEQALSLVQTKTSRVESRATASAASSAIGRPPSTSSVVQQHYPFQTATQSFSIFALTPQSKIEPPPAVAARSSPSPSPSYSRPTFASQLAMSSPFASPAPSSVRSSPPLEEAIHYQPSLSLSPPPGYTPRPIPSKHGRDSEEFVEHELTQGPDTLPIMTSAKVFRKRRRISSSSPSPSGSATESDSAVPPASGLQPVQMTGQNAGDVNYGGRTSPPCFGRRSGAMKLDFGRTAPSQSSLRMVDVDGDSLEKSDGQGFSSSRPRLLHDGRRSQQSQEMDTTTQSWRLEAAAYIDDLSVDADGAVLQTHAPYVIGTSQNSPVVDVH